VERTTVEVSMTRTFVLLLDMNEGPKAIEGFWHAAKKTTTITGNKKISRYRLNSFFSVLRIVSWLVSLFFLTLPGFLIKRCNNKRRNCYYFVSMYK
jgi:hypothetical protein